MKPTEKKRLQSGKKSEKFNKIKADYITHSFIVETRSYWVFRLIYDSISNPKLILRLLAHLGTNWDTSIFYPLLSSVASILVHIFFPQPVWSRTYCFGSPFSAGKVSSLQRLPVAASGSAQASSHARCRPAVLHTSTGTMAPIIQQITVRQFLEERIKHRLFSFKQSTMHILTNWFIFHCFRA